MIRLLSLIILFLLMYLLTFFKLGTFDDPGMQATVALGFLILVAYNIGELSNRIKLPKITGYMITGIIFGPYVLGFLSPAVITRLKLIDHIALSLIAFSAGRELKIAMIKRRFKSIFSITFFSISISFTVIAVFIFLGSSLFPFLKGSSMETVIVAAILFGLLSIAKSPVTTIAIIEETNAKGRFTDTVLGVVVLKDVILIILFALIMALAKVILLHSHAIDINFFAELTWKLIGSLAVGLIVGLLISSYIKYIKAELVIFIIGAAFLCTLIAYQLHLEPLLLSMTAGFYIENFSRKGDEFLSAIHKGSILIYLIFFAIAGASLNMDTLKDVWFIALILVVLRCASIWLGVSVGSWLVEDFKAIRRYGWMGFINQAGVTLVIATVIEDTFPAFGPSIKAIALAMIAITDYIGPPLFKYALGKAGEIKG